MTWGNTPMLQFFCTSHDLRQSPLVYLRPTIHSVRRTKQEWTKGQRPSLKRHHVCRGRTGASLGKIDERSAPGHESSGRASQNVGPARIGSECTGREARMATTRFSARAPKPIPRLQRQEIGTGETEPRRTTQSPVRNRHGPLPSRFCRAI